MLQMKNMVVDSAKELKKVQTLVFVALLIALGIVLDSFSIQLTQEIKIGVSFIANQLCAVLFGPVVAGIMGGTADILKFFIKPTGPFFWGWTLNAIVGPVIYGFLLYKKPIRLWRILMSKAVVAIVVNMLLGSYWMTMVYGKAFLPMITVKGVQQLIQVPIQSILFYLVLKALQQAKVLQIISK